MSQVKVKILSSQLSSVVGVTMLVVGLMAGAIAPYLATAQAPAVPNTTANTSFPDTQNHWAQPFIQALAQRNIVTGYPDNTFRPAQTVDRDEFAAILRKAFDRDPERQIASGSTYKDVPKGYWASQAIEDGIHERLSRRSVSPQATHYQSPSVNFTSSQPQIAFNYSYYYASNPLIKPQSILSVVNLRSYFNQID